MAAKYFCDVCQREMPADECGRLQLKLGAVKVEVTHCFNGTWNAGHVCHKCIKATVEGGKPFRESA